MGSKSRDHKRFSMERVMGIEPTSKAWEAFILPLNYTRLWFSSAIFRSLKSRLPLKMSVTAFYLSPLEADKTIQAEALNIIRSQDTSVYDRAAD